MRLKYAGLKVDKLVLEHSLDKAVELLLSERKTEEVVFALPTYTNLFPLRKLLESRLEVINQSPMSKSKGVSGK